MVYICILLGIAIGLAIGRKYSPKNKVHKLLVAILLPLIIGFLLALIIFAIFKSQDPNSDCWYETGGAMAPVIFGIISLIITLLVKLKVKKEETIITENSPSQLHYGTGENRVDFEIELTENEIKKMEELRQQDPQRWLDNDLELVKAVKMATKDDTQKEEPVIDEVVSVKHDDDVHKEQPQTNDTDIKSEIVIETKVAPHWIRQNGIEMCINIDDATFQQMVKFQKENPQKWVDNEFELLQTVKAKNASNLNDNNFKKNNLKWIILCIFLVIISIFATIIIYNQTRNTNISSNHNSSNSNYNSSSVNYNSSSGSSEQISHDNYTGFNANPQNSKNKKELSYVEIYSEGYDAGYDQGFDDGLLDFDYGFGYDDSNDYSGYYETQYEDGYKSGYDDGFNLTKSNNYDDDDYDDDDDYW